MAQHLYQPVTREAFRDIAFAWIQTCERNGHRFPTAENAVHVWVVRRLARQSGS